MVDIIHMEVFHRVPCLGIPGAAGKPQWLHKLRNKIPSFPEHPKNRTWQPYPKWRNKDSITRTFALTKLSRSKLHQQNSSAGGTQGLTKAPAAADEHMPAGAPSTQPGTQTRQHPTGLRRKAGFDPAAPEPHVPSWKTRHKSTHEPSFLWKEMHHAKSSNYVFTQVHFFFSFYLGKGRSTYTSWEKQPSPAQRYISSLS